MLHGRLLRLGFLELLFELLNFLGQISHLSRVTTALFPGLLYGIKGLMRLACLFAVLVEPTTLASVMGLEGPTRRLTPHAVLGGACLLGGLSSQTAAVPFLAGYTSPFLGGCANLGLHGSGFLIVFLNKGLLVVLRLWSIDLVNSGMVLWFNS